MKRKATDWKKVFAKYITDKELLSRILTIQSLEDKQPNNETGTQFE